MWNKIKQLFKTREETEEEKLERKADEYNPKYGMTNGEMLMNNNPDYYD